MTLPFAIPVIETDRLTLRAPRESDAPALADFLSGPRSRFLGGPWPRSYGWWSVLETIGHWALRGYGFWSVDVRSATGSADFVGRVGVNLNEGWSEPELGWQIFDGHEGHGYAREAALAARDHAYRVLGLGPLISMIAVENHRSITLVERLGAVFERAEAEAEMPFLVYRHPGPEARP